MQQTSTAARESRRRIGLTRYPVAGGTVETDGESRFAAIRRASCTPMSDVQKWIDGLWAGKVVGRIVLKH